MSGKNKKKFDGLTNDESRRGAAAKVILRLAAGQSYRAIVKGKGL
jgi:hypothetical protein